MRKTTPPLERFWRHVAPADDRGCMNWTGGTDGHGYGRFRADRPVGAPRFAYAIEHGPIPAGLQIDHECNNPRCVNVAHL